jgi:hypothetical protein
MGLSWRLRDRTLTYNTQWLIGRLGYRTPKEAYQDSQATAAA